MTVVLLLAALTLFGIAAVLIIFMTSFRRGDSLKYCFWKLIVPQRVQIEFLAVKQQYQALLHLVEFPFFTTEVKPYLEPLL